MVGLFLALSGLSALLISLSGRRGKIFFFAFCFYFFQLLLCGYVICFEQQVTFWTFFTVDSISLALFTIISFIGTLSAIASYYNLDPDDIKRQKIYYIALMLLDLMLLGVIFSNNIVVNWIFLEGTTLAVAGIAYHHRNFSAVEATWKYIFVSSVGIAITYMGILLLGSESSHMEVGLSYQELRTIVADISPLILKVAFLLIFVGYSVKMEVVPLYTATIDVNHSSPSPSAAFISSALAGGAMLSLFRLYGVISQNAEVFQWVKHLLLLVGVLSIAFSAVYMGRTGNGKRLLSYSTVENSGIALLGLSIGGIGIFAAILHTFAHMIVKSILFLQIGTVGKIYGTLTLGKHSGYMKTDTVGAIVLILGVIAISAFPPSVLFTSEITIFAELVSGNFLWALVIAMVMLLLAMYWMFERIMLMVFRSPSSSLPAPDGSKKTTALSIFLLVVLILFFAFGFVMPESFVLYLTSIANSLING